MRSEFLFELTSRFNLMTNRLFVCECSGNAAGEAGRPGISHSPRRRISSRGRGHTAFRRPAAADLVQRISILGDCAQRGKPSSLTSGRHAHHPGHRQVRKEKPSGSPSGDLHLQAHFRGSSGTQGVRGDQHLLPGEN